MSDDPIDGNPLAALLLATARTDPERSAVVDVDHPGRSVLTHGDLQERSAALAHVLVAAGARPGDRVVVQVEKSAAALLLHLACLRAGAVLVPLNPTATDAEVAWFIHDADPALVVLDPRYAGRAGARPSLTLDADGAGSLADEAASAPTRFADVPREASDPASMLYTSGTTGRPKGAVLSQGNLLANARALTAAWGFVQDDVLLHVLPLFHTHGLFVAAHCALASGSTLRLHQRFEATRVVSDLPMTTVLMGVPTHYTRLLAEPGFDAESTRHLRLLTSGSAPMLVETHRLVQQRTGHTVLERYGMTETCMLTSNPLHGPRRIGTVGTPLPGVGLRVTDDHDEPLGAGQVGGVQVRGPGVFAGYWRRPELVATEFTTDGWFRTGDLGRLDADGYLELVGRSKDLVISGGLNVYPKEVERVLDSVEGVVESAVIGVPDPDLGEAVVAVVALAPESAIDGEAIRAAARQRLAGYKVPKRVEVVDALPRNAMGKVEKAWLRSQYGAAR